MKRLLLAILAAFLISFILSTAIDVVLHSTGVYPPFGQPFFDTDLYLLALGYRFVITIFAAYVAAVIAKEQAKKALWITGMIGTIFWIAGTIVTQGLGPLWYGITGAATTIPLVLFGGTLYELRRKKIQVGS
ncbi:MAG: hypothetical protein KGJ59_03320 [Bacteroidota bacterium]|nr:hypothetical protein [Bacteroidota bacterium]